MRVILITGVGRGKSFTAEAFRLQYEAMSVHVEIKTLEYGTKKEAAAAISACSSNYLVLVANVAAEMLQIEPWQTISVSGGYLEAKHGDLLDTPTHTLGESA